jgi:hypothetical protein
VGRHSPAASHTWVPGQSKWSTQVLETFVAIPQCDFVLGLKSYF